MTQRQRQRPVPAHRMAEDGARLRRRELSVDQIDQLARDIALHAEMRRPRRFRRIDIKARALAQIIGVVIGDTLPARRSVGRDDDDAVFGGGLVGPGLGGEVVLGAGQARQPDQDRERPLSRRNKDRQRHGRARRRAVVLQIAQRPAVNDVALDRFHKTQTPDQSGQTVAMKASSSRPPSFEKCAYQSRGIGGWAPAGAAPPPQASKPMPTSTGPLRTAGAGTASTAATAAASVSGLGAGSPVTTQAFDRPPGLTITNTMPEAPGWTGAARTAVSAAAPAACR